MDSYWQKWRSCGVAGFLFLSLGCRREAAAPVPPAVLVADARPVVAPAKAAVLPSPVAAPAVPTDPSDPLTVPSIEISGEIQLPPGMGTLPAASYVYVCRNSCLDDPPQLLRRMPVSDSGTFLVEVVAEPGSQLSIWAAVDGPAGQPSHLYGQSGQLLRVGPQPLQDLRELNIGLIESPPHRFPIPPAKKK